MVKVVKLSPRAQQSSVKLYLAERTDRLTLLNMVRHRISTMRRIIPTFFNYGAVGDFK